MHSEITVKFSEEQQFRLSTAHPVQMSDEEAKAWLAQEYNDFGCEPLNPVGKVLAADKVLNVARAAGPGLFADSAWAGKYARAVAASLHRPVVRVDVTAMSIAY